MMPSPSEPRLRTFFGELLPGRLDDVLESWLRGPGHPFKLRLYAWAIRKLRGGRSFVTLHGTRFRVDLGDYIGERMIFQKGYEHDSLALALDLMREGGVFLDVGANFGLYSMVIAGLPGVRVLAFEPEEHCFSRLRYHAFLNGRSNVALHNYALTERPAILPFETPMDCNIGGTRVVNPAESGTAGEGRTLGPVHRAGLALDAVLREAAVDRIDLMKLDVEGHELKVLLGMDWAASRKPRNILAEFIDHEDNRGETTKEDLLEFLSRKGYEALDIRGRPFTPGEAPPELNLWFRLRQGSSAP